MSEAPGTTPTPADQPPAQATPVPAEKQAEVAAVGEVDEFLPATEPTGGGRWQIPLLFLGLVLLGGGLHRIVAGYRPVTFEEEVSRVARLHEAGMLLRANAYLVDLLKEEKRPPEQRAELHRLLARTVYRAESAREEHPRQNTKSILHNFQMARRGGAELGADDWTALGEAYTWSDNETEAVAAFREALREHPDRPDRIRRKLVELQSRSVADLSPESLADLDSILNGESESAGGQDQPQPKPSPASPGNYLWALEYKVEWLLDQGNTAPARDLVEAAKERLSGTGELLALSYLDAVCLHREGRPMEAETVLRSLLNEWTAHDTLWAKANLLLGRLQQADDRPQAALSFYDEVMRSFVTGEIHDACVLGRAECLAALREYEESLAAFTALKDLIPAKGHHRYLDRDAVRTTITTLGESLLQQGRLALSVQYMELAAAMTDSSATELRARYLSRIADSLTRMGRAAKAEPGGPAQDRAEELFAKAGEMYVSLADLQTANEEASARALESAAQAFDAAGLTDRQIEVLSRFAREHLGHNRRVTALYRLGCAYQSQQRYREAVAAYDEAITSYPRLPDALNSMVPMAECLIAMGGENAQRGVSLLTDIVDDRGPDAMFAPQAREYRNALMCLAEYFTRASNEEVPDHFEKAVARLEEAIAHYPDDPQMPRLNFLLADSYRRSGQLLRQEADALTSESARDAAQKEADRRMQRALEAYGKTIAALAAQDDAELTEMERTYLRMSYLYRGDCLFDLALYDQAVEAYREATWRYENLPAAVSASTQIIHCYLRQGQTAEASAALARLKWLLKKIPASAFEAERGMSSKDFWEGMVDRMASAGLY
ncbi:MAG TPA: tetratricopeptide repeat protein [Phycisphaerae bacterium]|nr:tetratricopeptide repeat protein [Phycisphaerae bacterium]